MTFNLDLDSDLIYKFLCLCVFFVLVFLLYKIYKKITDVSEKLKTVINKINKKEEDEFWSRHNIIPNFEEVDKASSSKDDL